MTSTHYQQLLFNVDGIFIAPAEGNYVINGYHTNGYHIYLRYGDSIRIGPGTLITKIA